MDRANADNARAKRSHPKRPQSDPSRSPFFRPTDPRKKQKEFLPASIEKRSGEAVVDVDESKSSVLGCYGNLIMVIVGAGIVGMPYAMKEVGLVAGVFMVTFVAIMTEKSLRLLIETGKHVDVQSYETLLESAFGKPGFVFISLNMFVISYGAMVSYLIILKDTIPVLMGVDPDDEYTKRVVLVVSSLLVVLPLSAQRDIADLSKTSIIGVVFDVIMVVIIVFYSPVVRSVQTAGGLARVLSRSTLEPSTFFIGLGVLSFAFVCQDSSFIIAGSLNKPTEARWAIVTRLALGTCAFLALAVGTSGYLAFQSRTDGNVLNNFVDPETTIPAYVARALMGSTMFFCYPLASYVARHVCIVLLFRGRRAHEGDDHSVLARPDRRIALTVALYLLAIVPAVLFEDLGVVLAITGAIGGSCLSYVGPGAAYLGVHGSEFQELMREVWGGGVGGGGGGAGGAHLWNYPRIWEPFRWSKTSLQSIEEGDRDGAATIGMTLEEERSSDAPDDKEEERSSPAALRRVLLEAFHFLSWYLLLMPLWCAIASIGQRGVVAHLEKEALKSPLPSRLGKVLHRNRTTAFGNSSDSLSSEEDKERKPLLHSSSDPALSRGSGFLIPPPQSGRVSPLPAGYGAAGMTTLGTAEINAAIQKRSSAASLISSDEGELDPQEGRPTMSDFAIAVGYILFGVVAFCAGLVSLSV